MRTDRIAGARGRKSVAAGMILVVLLTAILIGGGIFLLVSTRLKIQLNILEELAERDQKPTLQALSYSTVGFMQNSPISFYDLVSLSAVLGRDDYTLGGNRVSAEETVDNQIDYFSETSLAAYPISCFDYALSGEDGTVIFNRIISSGTLPAEKESCEEIANELGEVGLVATAKRGYSYLIPLPPFKSNEARLTAQFIYDLEASEGASKIPDAERPFCKEEGVEAASPEECCSGRIEKGRCTRG